MLSSILAIELSSGAFATLCLAILLIVRFAPPLVMGLLLRGRCGRRTAPDHQPAVIPRRAQESLRAIPGRVAPGAMAAASDRRARVLVLVPAGRDADPEAPALPGREVPARPREKYSVVDE